MRRYLVFNANTGERIAVVRTVEEARAKAKSFPSWDYKQTF